MILRATNRAKAQARYGAPAWPHCAAGYRYSAQLSLYAAPRVLARTLGGNGR